MPKTMLRTEEPLSRKKKLHLERLKKHWQTIFQWGERIADRMEDDIQRHAKLTKRDCGEEMRWSFSSRRSRELQRTFRRFVTLNKLIQLWHMNLYLVAGCPEFGLEPAQPHSDLIAKFRRQLWKSLDPSTSPRVLAVFNNWIMARSGWFSSNLLEVEPTPAMIKLSHHLVDNQRIDGHRFLRCVTNSLHVVRPQRLQRRLNAMMPELCAELDRKCKELKQDIKVDGPAWCYPPDEDGGHYVG